MKLVHIAFVLVCCLAITALDARIVSASVEIQVLTPSNGVQDDSFGSSISIDGDLAAIGAPFADIDGTQDQGAVYIFERQGDGSWVESTVVTAADGQQYDQFGFAVAIQGNRLVVGAEEATSNGNSSEGAAYIFERESAGSTNWVQVARLNGPTIIGNHAEFGHSVALDGDRVLVGAPGAGPSTHGGAYLFERNQGGADNWGEAAAYYDDIYDTNAGMGTGVDIDGDRIVIGAEYLDAVQNSYSNEGGVYIYEYDGGWSQVAKVFGSNATNNDRAGRAVAILGDRVAFGAWNQEGGSSGEGCVYLVERQIDGQWTEQALLTAGDAMTYSLFGRALDLDDGFLAVGASGHANDQGGAYRFDADAAEPANWSQADQLTYAGAAIGDFSGSAVAADAGIIMVGAVGNGTGVVRVYDAPGGNTTSATPDIARTPLRLMPNSPNPFNPITTISFSLDRSEHVLIEVFDPAGRLVDTLARREMGPGEHRLKWDASGLGSGVYLYRVNAGGVVGVGRCTLVK